jgi:hypothetical protein
MEKITSVAGLKNAIQILEDDQAIKGKLLKDQFYRTYESFKPAKLLGSTLKEMVASSYLIDNVIDTTVALASGYLTRRIVVGASGNILRRLLGTVLQVGVSKFMANHSDNIKAASQFAFRNIFRKKKPDKEKP